VAEALQVNPIACDAHGACAELLPEMITPDEWGYPVLDSRPVPAALGKRARAAVSACPTLALRLTREFSGSAAPVTVPRPPARQLPRRLPRSFLSRALLSAVSGLPGHYVVDTTRRV
jgi:ferredoxin